MLISQTEGLFFRITYALSVGFKNENSKKKRFRMLRQKPTQVLPLKLLKEATILFTVYWMNTFFRDLYNNGIKRT